MMNRPLVAVLLAASIAHSAGAQPSCNSDGQPTPSALVERFLSADCESCWSAQRVVKTDPHAVTLDWIVPSSQGDDAPLSAAASRDALQRLESLGLAAPAASAARTTEALGQSGYQLRVAQGPSIGGYIGAIIELRTSVTVRHEAPLRAWLLLVETVAAGSEGTPVERNLVRNMLVATWRESDQRAVGGQSVFSELRPMNIPQGAWPERLRVVGWVEDGFGRLLSAARSVCSTSIE